MKNIFRKVAIEHFALGLQLPLTVVLPLERGLSLIEIGVMQSVLMVTTVLFEVPSGYVADKLGRKYAMAISSGLFAFGFFLYGVAQSFAAFVFASALLGIGFAFLSGVDEAYLFDALKEKKEEHTYKQWFGKLTIIDEAATILGLIFSAGIVFFLNPTTVFFASSLFMIATLVYTLKVLPETRYRTHEIVTGSELEQLSPNFFRRFMRVISQHSIIIVPLVAFAFLAESGRLLWQPKMLDIGLSAAFLGVVYAVLKIFSIFGSWAGSSIKGRVSRGHFLLLGALSVFSFLLIGISTNAFLVFAGFAGFFFLENIFRLLQSEYLNQRTNSKYRATFLSLNSLVTSLFSAFFVIGLGAIAGVHLLYGFLLLVSLKLFAIFLLLFLPQEV